jgi:hypothetical protein
VEENCAIKDLRCLRPVVTVCQLLILLNVALTSVGCGGGSATPTGRADTSSTSAAASERPASRSASSHSSRYRVRGPTLSDGATQFGQRSKTSGCQPRGALPDAACTPGSIITQATAARICVSGYTQSVRDVPISLKAGVYAEYGIVAHQAGQYEVDHLVPLELGGSNSVANLWPEIAPGFHEKDAVENELHAAVCAGSTGLRQAQARIAHDWQKAGVGVPAASSGSFPTDPAPRPSRAVSTNSPSDAGFCTTHACIASFAAGRGTIVPCADGEWSHSGGLPGVCSRHGGPKG